MEAVVAENSSRESISTWLIDPLAYIPSCNLKEVTYRIYIQAKPDKAPLHDCKEEPSRIDWAGLEVAAARHQCVANIVLDFTKRNYNRFMASYAPAFHSQVRKLEHLRISIEMM
jgi:hypothetical protein